MPKIKHYGVWDLKYIYNIKYPINSKKEKIYKVFCKFNIHTHTHYTITKINMLNDEVDKIYGSHHDINWYVKKILPDSYFVKKYRKNKHNYQFAFYNKEY